MIGRLPFSAKAAVPAGARLGHRCWSPPSRRWHRPLRCSEAAPACHLLGDSSVLLAGFGAAPPPRGRGDRRGVAVPVSCRELRAARGAPAAAVGHRDAVALGFGDPWSQRPEPGSACLRRGARRHRQCRTVALQTW